MLSLDPHFSEAAARHFRSGDRLIAENEFAEAGYLYGLAAECAVKAVLAPNNTLPKKLRKHFPELVDAVLDYAEGRSIGRLAEELSRTKQPYLAGWHTDVRYAGNKSVPCDQAEQWRMDANKLLEWMEK